MPPLSSAISSVAKDNGYGVGVFAYLINSSGAAVASGATVAGGSLANGGSNFQTGTWRNIQNTSIADASSGNFQRIA